MTKIWHKIEVGQKFWYGGNFDFLREYLTKRTEIFSEDSLMLGQSIAEDRLLKFQLVLSQ